MHAPLQVQELFEDLQLSPSHHRDEDSDASASADSVLQRKLENFDGRRDSEACNTIDADEEMAKLISYFENQGSQRATQASATKQLSMNATVVALPPAVRYNRASRKAVPKPPA